MGKPDRHNPFSAAPSFVIEGARVVLEDRVEVAAVRCEDGRITGLDVACDGARRIDGRGLVLAPAFVDVHGDAFERQIMPRPGVTVPMDAALLETDRQLAANGIATAYHALTLGWEPGLRSVETGWQVMQGLDRLAQRLTVENRLQLRWETFCPEALPLIASALDAPLTPSVAFNDHTSSALLHPSIAVQDRPFDLVPDYPMTDTSSAQFRTKMDSRAKRSGLSQADYAALMLSVWNRRGRVADDIAAVAFLARDRAALAGSFRVWRASLGAGFLGAFASEFWFIGFSLTSAANVRTFALIEVIFAQIVARYWFTQKTSARQLAGMGVIVLGVGVLLRLHA